MRHLPFSLAVTAALLPVVLTASAVPASAAGNSLTVTAIGRHGAKVAATAYAVNVANNDFYSLTTGKAVSLPKGQYAVSADIEEPGGSWMTDTLAARIVSVSGHTVTTLDGRQGKPLRVTVDGATGAGDTANRIDAHICAGSYGFGAGAWNHPGSIYVVPSTSKLLRYSYIANIQGAKKSYVVSGANKAGIPSSPGGSFHSASLAKLTVQVRANEYQEAQITTELRQNPEGTPSAMCQFGLSRTLRTASAPYALDTYASPGTWRLEKTVADSRGTTVESDDSPDLRLVAGHAYSQMLNRAAYAPWMRYPELWQRAVLFVPDSMIESPDQQTGPWDLGGVRETVQLTKGGKLVKKAGPSSGKSFKATISSAGWYRLTADAVRYAGGRALPAGILSTRVNLDMHFYANPARSEVLPVFLTKFVPAGLNRYNHAAARSRTVLRVTTSQLLSGAYSSPKIRAVKSVKVWASNDNGRTWHAVTMKRSGGTWTGTVQNPASGKVSLRSQVADPAGDYTTETVYAAYGVG